MTEQDGLGKPAMRIYKNKSFAKFARKERISDATLCKVVKDAEAGKIDADYGGGVIKQRIARPNEGKSGGYRSIILFRKGTRAFFVYGFSKKDLENISEAQVSGFKQLAEALLPLADEDVAKLLKNGTYQEIKCDD